MTSKKVLDVGHMLENHGLLVGTLTLLFIRRKDGITEVLIRMLLILRVSSMNSCWWI